MIDPASVNLIELEKRWRQELEQLEEEVERAELRREGKEKDIEALKRLISSISGHRSESAQPETTVGFKAKVSSLWKRARNEQKALLAHILNHFPEFVEIDAETQRKLGLAESDTTSGLLSGLAQICKSEGFSFDDVIQKRRKSSGKIRPTYYRLRNDAVEPLREVMEEVGEATRLAERLHASFRS